ncbi:MAG TPA: BrnA antitoxin family protein [Afifellaceae bacterium]|nr:BrnA antitoxin family protein [Afifellaceae bacterium]
MSERKGATAKRKDWADPDNPEWTEADFAAARPAAAVHPDLVAAARRRGPQKAPTKVATTIRLDPNIVEYFRAGGPGWQTRINEALKRYIEKSDA